MKQPPLNSAAPIRVIHRPGRLLSATIMIAGLVTQIWIGSNGAMAQSSLRIAAIVNDEIISGFDLESRLKLVMMSSRLPDRPEVRRRFRPQILRNLVDERLRLQEAARVGIKVKLEDVKRAVGALEKRNNMPPGAMAKLLAQNGLDTLALERRLEGELAWGRVVRRRTRSSADISADDIDTEISHIEADKGKPEYLVSEIFLQATADQSTRQVQEFAKRIVGQVRGGASFSALATTFSLSASGESGGDLGWVRPDQLDPVVAKQVAILNAGDISEPIASSDGVYVVQVRNTRLSPGLGAQKIQMSLRNYLAPVRTGLSAADVGNFKRQVETSFASARSCADFDRIAGTLKEGRAGRLTNVQLSSLAENMRDAVRTLPLGRASPALSVSNNLLVLMVCRREIQNTQEETRKRIRNMLLERRADLVSRRIMRNLRRKAFVDIRS